MRIWTVLGGAVVLVLTACNPDSQPAGTGNWVPREEFDAYKAEIKKDGDALDGWVEKANPWFVWLNDNAGKFCPNCEPPELPPTPPPNGDWE